MKVATNLKFLLDKRIKELKIEKDSALNEMRIRCSDNPNYLVNMLKKLLSVSIINSH